MTIVIDTTTEQIDVSTAIVETVVITTAARGPQGLPGTIVAVGPVAPPGQHNVGDLWVNTS